MISQFFHLCFRFLPDSIPIFLSYLVHQQNFHSISKDAHKKESQTNSSEQKKKKLWNLFHLNVHLHMFIGHDSPSSAAAQYKTR